MAQKFVSRSCCCTAAVSPTRPRTLSPPEEPAVRVEGVDAAFRGQDRGGAVQVEMLHEVASDLVVRVAQARGGGGPGHQQESRVLDAAGGEDEQPGLDVEAAARQARDPCPMDSRGRSRRLQLHDVGVQVGGDVVRASGCRRRTPPRSGSAGSGAGSGSAGARPGTRSAGCRAAASPRWRTRTARAGTAPALCRRRGGDRPVRWATRCGGPRRDGRSPSDRAADTRRPTRSWCLRSTARASGWRRAGSTGRRASRHRRGTGSPRRRSVRRSRAAPRGTIGGRARARS